MRSACDSRCDWQVDSFMKISLLHPATWQRSCSNRTTFLQTQWRPPTSLYNSYLSGYSYWDRPKYHLYYNQRWQHVATVIAKELCHLLCRSYSSCYVYTLLFATDSQRHIYLLMLYHALKRNERDWTYSWAHKADVSTDRKEYFHMYCNGDVKLKINSEFLP